MKLVILFALLGATYALQSPLEYVYLYEGRIATGIPGIKPQVAGFGFRARLTLQLKTKTVAIAQLDDIYVGEYNGDQECEHLRKPMPINYSPLNKFADKFKEPFTVYFIEEQGQVLQVPEGEEEFVTNVRKAIVLVLRQEALLANLGGSKNDPLSSRFRGENVPESFSVEEETIMGRCRCDYTLRKLPDYVAEVEERRLQSKIKQDVQLKRSSSTAAASIPALKKELWRLVRAVDFDKCHENVMLQKSTVSNMNRTSFAQSKSYMSRSSVGEYILRGEGGNFRLEAAVVEGTILAHPFGHRTDKLQTIINQTMVLEEVRPIQKPLQVPTKVRSVKTWNYEVASPFAAPSGTPPTWINYKAKGDKFTPFLLEAAVIGKEITPQLEEEMKTRTLDLLKKAVEELTASPRDPSDNPGPWNNKLAVAATHLMSSVHALRALPPPKIEEIFSQVFQKHDNKGQIEQMLLVDVAAAAGSASSMKVILEKIKSGQISKTRAATIFASLTNHLTSPAVIPELMEYVKSLNLDQEPYLTSAALTNFAKVSHYLCLDHRKFNYSAPNKAYGKEICSSAEIINNFLPFLKQKLESSSKTWERTIYIRALANLRIPQILPILEPFIYGKVDPNPRVRTFAIYALSGLPSRERENVFNILMKLVENLGEDLEMRQAAFASLLSWHPTAAWWQRVARLTWREPSHHMSAFISFTIKSIAESTDPKFADQAKIAQFVRPLCKPHSPNLRTSFNSILRRHLHHEKLSTDLNLAWLSNLHSVVPNEVYTFLKASFGGFKYELFELAVGADGLHKPLYDVLDQLELFTKRHSHEHSHNARTPHHRRVQEILETVKTEISPPEYTATKPEVNVLLRAFDNMEQVFPINGEIVQKFIGSGGSKLVEELMRGKNYNITKLVNAVPIKFFLPTENGLPMIGEVSAPIVLLSNVHLKLHVPGKSQLKLHDLLKEEQVELAFKTDFKFVSKITSMMKTLIPWQEEKVASIIDSVKVVDLPATGRVILDNRSFFKNITLELHPTVKEKLPVVYIHNIPMTAIKPLLPGYDVTEVKKIEPITVDRSRQPVIKKRLHTDPRRSGIDGYLQYDGDVPFPFSPAYVFDYLRKPTRLLSLLTSPTSKMYQIAVMYDQSKSPAKKVSLSFALLKAPFSSSSEKLYEKEETRHPTRSEPNGSKEEGLSALDSPPERRRKLEKEFSGERTYAVSLALITNGEESRRFEIMGAHSRVRSEGEEKRYKTLLGLFASPLPGYHEEQSALCLETFSEAPEVTDVESLRRKISSDLKMSLRGSIRLGKSCMSTTIADIEGSAKVSEERKERLKKETKDLCEFDGFNPLVEFRTAAVYDEARLEVKFEKSSIPRPLLNVSLNAGTMITGLAFPHVYVNRMDVQNPEGRIGLIAKRPLTTDRWTVRAHLPRENVIMDYVYVPYILDRIVPVRGLRDHWSTISASNAILLSYGQPKCVIRPDKTTTFDGVNVQFALTKCYTTAVMDLSDRDWFLHTRINPSTSSPEAHIFYTSGNSLEATNTYVKMDGQEVHLNRPAEPIKDKEGNVIAYATRKGNSIILALRNELLTIIVKPKDIEVMPAPRTKGRLRGLCGDFDTETTYDKTGPKNCIYSDDSLFGWSWTISEGDGCNTQEVEKHQEEVKKFQENCPKRPSRNVVSTYYRENNNCIRHVYPIVNREGNLCITKEPIRKCKDKCSMSKRIVTEVMCKCWPHKEAPEDIKLNVETGYLSHPSKSMARFTKKMEVLEETECNQNRS